MCGLGRDSCECLVQMVDGAVLLRIGHLYHILFYGKPNKQDILSPGLQVTILECVFKSNSGENLT